MKINSFEAVGVHGYLKFNLNFYSELTFLIGINGSGKTSALKLILGLTSPSFQYLSKIDFEYCSVVCSSLNDEKDILIRADKVNEEFFTLSLTLNGEMHVTPPIEKTTGDWGFDPQDLPLHESRLREIFDGSEITKRIRELATPKYLGLDRRVYEGRLIDNRYFRHKHFFSNKSNRRRNSENPIDAPAIDYSLDEVQQMVYDYTRKIAQQQPIISEDFKQKIFKQSFNFPDEPVAAEPIPSDIESITRRKSDVLDAISNLGMGYLNADIINYFKKLENLVTVHSNFTAEYVKQNPTKKLNSTGAIDDLFKNYDYVQVVTKWYNNISQLQRINEIISFSEAYQQKINELRTPIKRLEEIVTNFLAEGSKKLSIDPDGDIKVILKNGNEASIYELSSGEKQIIIMIAHLIFEEDVKPSGIFIIDEPELSLHIAWQEIFVDSIIAASPKTQFILATHAPAIISKTERELLCQDLNTKS